MGDIDIEVICDIEGLAELEEAFTGGSERAVTKFLRGVEMKTAKILVESAKEYAPYQDGDLEGDIHRMSLRRADLLYQSPKRLLTRADSNGKSSAGLHAAVEVIRANMGLPPRRLRALLRQLL